MSDAPAIDPFNLGAVTEARLARYFTDRPILTATATADLLQLDTDTLRSMTDEGLIRAVRKGKVRGYTEIDVRRYFATCPDIARAEPVKKEPARRGGKIVPFSARMGAHGRERL